MLWQSLQADIKNHLSFIPTKKQTQLQSFDLLQLSGLDASEFLNRQLTQDISKLNISQAIWAAYCSAKGRVLACFWVLKATDESFYLMLPKEQSAWLQKRLMMFVLRAKVKIEFVDDLMLLGGWHHQNQASSALENTLMFDLPKLAHLSSDTHLDHTMNNRFVLLAPKLSIETEDAPADQNQHTQMAWAVADWRAGLSWINESSREQCTPHDLSLDRAQGVSFNKGCYPGQEIVARMHYLGRAKQRLSLWMLSGVASIPLKTGGDVFLPEQDQAIGVVVSWFKVQGEAQNNVCVSLSTSGFSQWQVGQVQRFKLSDGVYIDCECVAILV
jgi:folate-binding protein YgfZ